MVKGFKTGTNEAYNIKIKTSLGGGGGAAFWNFSAFVRTPVWLLQTKAFHWRGKFLKRFSLNFNIKRNEWKELTKLTKLKIQNIITQRGSPWSTWFKSQFESVFRALFSCEIYIVNKQDSKNMFLRNFDSVVKSLYTKQLSWNISKTFNLSKCLRRSIWYQLPLYQLWNLYQF